MILPARGQALTPPSAVAPGGVADGRSDCPAAGLVPMVVEQTSAASGPSTSTRLLNERIIFLGTPITEDIANLIVAH